MAWDNAVVTNAGISLLQQVLAGETLTLDKAAGGTGTVPASALMAQIGLKEQKQELPITSVKNVSNGKKVCIQITNVGLASGYIMQQVGIWAHIGNNSPVLFAILQDDTGIAIPSRTEIPDFAMNLYAVINFSNESNFSLSVEPSALVTQGELNERIKNINASEIGAETPEGAQAKAVAAATVVQVELRNHIDDAEVHVTAGEREAWNAKETPAGAQSKAEAAAAAAVAAHDTKEKHIAYAVASGTNTYTVSIPGITQLAEGMSFKIKFANANTGACTLNINNLGAKNIVKGNGNALSSGNIKAGQICHLVYNGSNFQLLGEGGEYGTATPAEVLKGYTIGTEDGVKEGTLELTGNATTGDVLAGKTFYNTNAKSKQAGTMPNNGSQSATLTITGSGKPTKTIPAGYTTGGTITAQVDPSLASVIKNAVTVGGVQGNYKGEIVVHDITMSGSVSGIDNNYIYKTGTANMNKYNHAGTLISTYNTGLGSSYGGTYNDEGAIFIQDSSSGTARIYSDAGTLLYTVSGINARADSSMLPGNKCGYANNLIFTRDYTNMNILRLYNTSGTLVQSMELERKVSGSVSNYNFGFVSNYKKTIIYYIEGWNGNINKYAHLVYGASSFVEEYQPFQNDLSVFINFFSL